MSEKPVVKAEQIVARAPKWYYRGRNNSCPWWNIINLGFQPELIERPDEPYSFQRTETPPCL